MFTLGFYNCFAHDDYGVIIKVSELGLSGAVIDWYLHWSGRWAANFLIGFLIHVFWIKSALFAFSILTLGFLLWACYLFIRNALQLQETGSPATRQLPLLSALFGISLFYLTFDVGETWFWPTGSISYLWSSLACILGVGLVLSMKSTWVHWVGILACFTYVGGANEGLTAVVGLGMLSLTIVSFFNKLIPIKVRTKLVIGLFGISLSFLVFIIAPGNMERKEHFPSASLAEIVMVSVLSFKILLKEYILPIWYYLLLFALPWVYAGYICKKDDKTEWKYLLKTWLIIAAITALLCFLAMLPTAYSLVSLGPKRYLIVVTLFLALSVVATGFSLGFYIKLPQLAGQMIIVAALCLITVVNVGNLLYQAPIVKRYAQAEAARINYLLQEKHNGREELLLLDPLPPSGMLKSNELSNDPEHFANQYMKRMYQLRFDLRVKTFEELEREN